MKKITFRCFFAFLMVALPSMAFADLITISPPTSSGWITGTIASRGIIFEAMDVFSLNSVGIELNLTGTQTLTASLWSVTGTSPTGSALATNSLQFGDIGQSWFDIPLNYSFAGNGDRYLLDISFNRRAPEAMFIYNNFQYGTNPPFPVGPISVLDGTASKNYSNPFLAHFRMAMSIPVPLGNPEETTPITETVIGLLPGSDTGASFTPENSQNSTSVPEPSTILLLCSGMIGLVGFRKKLLK